MLLVFSFLFLSYLYLFGALLDDAGSFLVVSVGASADGVGFLGDAVGQFVEVFAAVLNPPQERFVLLSLVFHSLFQSNVSYLFSKDSYLMYHLIVSMYGLGLYM